MLRYAFVLLALSTVPALGQIVYEPVQYQYIKDGQIYYYGGSSPYLVDFAERHAAFEAARPQPFFASARTHVPVWSDLLPYRDLTQWGFTPDLAANEANRNAPLYFRKADLLTAAIPSPDGTVLVPGKGAAPVVVPAPALRGRIPTTLPAKGQILIIPKSLLDRPLRSFMPRDRQVATATR